MSKKTSFEAEVDIRELGELTALVGGCTDGRSDAAEQVQVSLYNVSTNRV